MSHQLLGLGDGRLPKHLHQVGGSADLRARRPHVFHDSCRGVFGPGMWGHDNGVATLQRQQRLDRRCGIRASGWDKRGHYANRLGDLHQSAFGIFLYDPHRAHRAHVGEYAQDPLVDLGDLVVVVAEAALVHRQLGQGLGTLRTGNGPGHCGAQLVDLLLRVVRDRCLSRPRSGHDR